MAIAAGKRPRPVSEYFAEQKTLGKRSTGYSNELPFFQPGNIVESVCNQFFSCSALADNQYGMVCFPTLRFFPIVNYFPPYLMGNTAESPHPLCFLKKKNPLENRFLRLIMPGHSVQFMLAGIFHPTLVGHKNKEGVVFQVLKMALRPGMRA